MDSMGAEQACKPICKGGLLVYLAPEKSPNEFLRHRGLDHAKPAWVPSRLVPPYARAGFWLLSLPKKSPAIFSGTEA